MTAPFLAGQLAGVDKTYSIVGFYILVSAVFVVLIAGVSVELWLVRGKRQALGHYINGFVMAYPWLAGVFALVVGAMIAHFFLGLYPHKEIIPALLRLVLPGRVP